MDAPLRILAVDNEPSITLSLRYVFAGPRYEVTCVEDGDAALAILDVHSDPYDVLIVDQKWARVDAPASRPEPCGPRPFS